MNYGAKIERGRVTDRGEGGYRVASLDRDGIESLFIPAIESNGESGPAEYTVGDTVYFFIFRDGTGRIICKA